MLAEDSAKCLRDLEDQLTRQLSKQALLRKTWMLMDMVVKNLTQFMW